MSDSKFISGVIVGAIAGIAGKIVYDNKEEVLDYLVDSYYIAKDEMCTFAQHCTQKAREAKEEIDEIKEEFSEFAEEQFNEMEEMAEEAAEASK